MTEEADRKSYRHPPIQEALVEFTFAPAQEWDLTMPGKVHERIKNSYPGKPRQQMVVQAALASPEGKAAGLALREGLNRIQLVNEDGTRLVAIGPGVISVNVLQPYDGWDKFRPRIEEALPVYSDVTGLAVVNRIGVRYINRMVIPARDSIRLEEYFKLGWAVIAGLPGKFAAFMHRVEYVFDAETKILLTFASLDSSDESAAFLLDLDVIWEESVGLEIGRAMAKADELHDLLVRAFESVITDRAREVFDAD